jgi:hypothetical protein
MTGNNSAWSSIWNTSYATWGVVSGNFSTAVTLAATNYSDINSRANYNISQWTNNSLSIYNNFANVSIGQINTTNGYLFSVNGSARINTTLLVNGSKVCTADGINCPATIASSGSSQWQNTTVNYIYFNNGNVSVGNGNMTVDNGYLSINQSKIYVNKTNINYTQTMFKSA